MELGKSSDERKKAIMLDTWIIEKILRREQRQEQERRTYLEIPLMPPEESDCEVKEEQEQRGVFIVDFEV